MLKKKLFPVAVVTLLMAGAARAHMVWVERDGAGPARAYFGEFAEGKYEKTGGSLDKIKSPRAFGASPKESFAIKRLEDHLEIAAKGAGDVRLLENGLAPREDKKEGGKSRTVFYGKAGRQDTAGKLDLELVPVEPGGKTFALMFRGTPLPKTSVTVYGPPKWEKSLRTDDQGRITVSTPWAGRYLLHVTNIEKAAGEAGGEKFDRTRHVMTLSFVQADGLPWTVDRSTP